MRCMAMTTGCLGDGHFPLPGLSLGRSPSWTSPLLFAYPDIPLSSYVWGRVRGLPPRVWRRRPHAPRCCTAALPIDVEEADKLQTLLATCCSGWRKRPWSAHHAASAAAAVPGAHLERTCRHAERRLPDEAWNRGFVAVVGRTPVSVVRHRVTVAKCGRGVDDTAAECTWPAAGKASQAVHPDSAASTAHHLCSMTWWLKNGERDLACGRAHSPLRVKMTVTLCWLLHYFFFLDISCI